LRPAQDRRAQLDFAPTLAAFASRSVISTPPDFAKDYSAHATLVIFVETHRLQTADAERAQGVSRKPSIHAIRESRIASSPRKKWLTGARRLSGCADALYFSVQRVGGLHWLDSIRILALRAARPSHRVTRVWNSFASPALCRHPARLCLLCRFSQKLHSICPMSFNSHRSSEAVGPLRCPRRWFGTGPPFFPTFLIRTWRNSVTIFRLVRSFQFRAFIVMAISNRLKSVKAWLGVLCLGSALFSSACANDESSSDNSSQHHRHHGGGGGGGRYGHGQGGMFDQSNPSGSQSPVPGQ